MPARNKPAVSSNPRASRVSKEKARTTIKTATVPKSKSLRSSKKVHESSTHTSSPISRPIATPVEGGELPSDDESLWEGLSQSDQRLDRDDPMDGIERMVRDTMSEVFADRDEKEKERNFATSAAIRVTGTSLEGDPAEGIIGTTKLQSSFKKPTTFFLAWHIYMSIRATFEPSRAAGLTDWRE